MKITRVSLQSKLDELISLLTRMKITRVSSRLSLQSKLDELILFFHTYHLIKITSDSLHSKLNELITLLTSILHAASTALKHALFSSSNTCGRMKEVHPASI